MTPWPKVLVTGAEEHQGLAVIRGLGRAGIPVVACGREPHSLGFYSRYAAENAAYESPFGDRERFVADILSAVERTRPSLIMPVAESTLVALSAAQHRLPPFAKLAAPAPEVLDYAVDKLRTLTLAAQLGVPAPRTAWGDTAEEILCRLEGFRFPVAIKPRGNALHSSTLNALGFKVRYATTLDELRTMLTSFERDVRAVLVQEYVPGTGRCVSAVCRDGIPLVQFAYARDREFPLSGGVSVLRKSIPLDPRLAEWTARMLGAIQWQGVAMVEFKYDESADRFTLMEINGRFQASTALALDAGINLPYLVTCVFLDREPGPVDGYRPGVRERWLRGDLLALRDGLSLARRRSPTRAPAGRIPPRRMVLWHFLRDFRPGVFYDEIKRDDWRPALVECAALGKLVLHWVVDVLKEPARRMVRIARRPRRHRLAKKITLALRPPAS
ncbi:MAG: ATP-grasp domain-containing protein [Gemmatimonadetes bacterium]|nr:ATP-grasp domain-containing protein [Gemmatimonadota bacterium]